MLPISLCGTRPTLETIPAFKTTEYPWADGSYKPLCHARLAAVKGRGLLCDLVAFEREGELNADVLSADCVAASFVFVCNAPVFTVAVERDGRFACFLDGVPFGARLSVDIYAGEDEQGWYWGARFYIPYDLVNRLCGVTEFEPSHIIKGGIFKFLRAGERSHMGAVFPMTDDSIFSRGNLGDFEIVPY